MRILLIILLCIPILASPQGRGHGGKGNYGKFKKPKNSFKGTINGRIIDKKSKNPLEFANISLINTKSNKIIEGTISANNGKFSMTKILLGSYKLTINYLGYKSQSINFALTKKKPDIRLDNIELEIGSEVLSEITIEEEKPIYESKIDKIVYNAENDINQGSDDATDVLRKAPLLSVDFDGNVELRGSRKIKFLLNGKASTFLSGDLSTALQMIPADEIKSIEVITSPGAKYDGEGDAGIVNIVTKKKIIDGYKATIDGSIGNRVNRNSYNLTFGEGRFSLSARGGVHYSWPREGITNYERNDWDENENVNTLTNNGISKSQWISYRGGMNMYYDINVYNSISSDINFSGRNTPSKNSTNYEYIGSFPQDTNYNYESTVDAKRKYKKIEWNTDYTRTFDNEDQELNISLQAGLRLDDEDTEISEQNEMIELININDEKNIEETFQIDYVHPIHSHKLEVGGKIINRDLEMQYTTTSHNLDYKQKKEIFNYNQMVVASYASTQWNLPNDFGLITGIRYEFTKINGSWNNDPNSDFDDSYPNLFPNLTFSKKISLGKTIKLSYNNRISRPSTKYINTNIDRTDNKNITIGNPELIPATTQQIELGYNSFNKIYQGSYYFYYKQTKDIIESFVNIQNDTSITNYQNIGKSQRYGLNYYGSVKIKKATLRLGFNIYNYITEDRNINRTAILYNYNFGGTFDLGKRWKAEAFGFFRSPSQTIQGYSTSFSMMSFGVKKDFKNKRGSLGIRIIEPFLKDGYKDFETKLEGENFTQNSVRKILFTSIGVSFKYTFGKLTFKERKIKTKIKNDDVQNDSGSEF